MEGKTNHPKFQNFSKAYKAGHLSHAHLLIGTEGYGGLSLALEIAKMLACPNGGSGHPCMECESCLKADKFLHPDIHFSFPFASYKTNGPKTTSKDWINDWKALVKENAYASYFDWLQTSDAGNKQGNINVAETEEIMRKLSLKSFQGGNKVMIIWMADFLSKEGNRLLKLIEEPPANTYFILTASKEQNVLTTIKSRTQITKLLPFENQKLKEILRAQDFEDSAIDNAIYLAEGDCNRAIYYANNAAENDQVEAFRLWMQYCAKSKIDRMSTWCDEMATSGREGIKVFLETALYLIRESVRNKCMENYAVRTESKYHAFVKNFSSFATLHTLDGMYEEINKHYYQITRNANSRINLFELSLTLNQILTQQK